MAELRRAEELDGLPELLDLTGGFGVAALGHRNPRILEAWREQEVVHALYTYLNPLVGGSPDGPSTGWQNGRALNQGELYGIVHGIEGVEFVRILRLYETDLRTGQQSPKPVGSHVVLESDEVIASGTHIVRAVHAQPE